MMRHHRNICAILLIVVLCISIICHVTTHMGLLTLQRWLQYDYPGNDHEDLVEEKRELHNSWILRQGRQSIGKSISRTGVAQTSYKSLELGKRHLTTAPSATHLYQDRLSISNRQRYSLNRDTPETVNSKQEINIRNSTSREISRRVNELAIPDKLYANGALFVNRPPISEGVNVLIAAAYRTGSTFYSEVFNRNPDFMFLFEPLATVSREYYPSPKTATSILKGMYTCTFNETSVASRIRDGWKRNILCGSGQNNSGKCSRSERNSAKLDMTSWLKKWSEFCKTLRRRAVKVIRLRAIEDIEVLTRRGLKVIILLRDPRGMTASRIETPGHFHVRQSDTVLAEEARNYCDMALNNVRYVRTLHRSYPEQMEKSFYFGRYEDLAADPITTLRDIYHFVGIKPNEQVIHWFQEHQMSKPLTTNPTVINDKKRKFHTYDTQRENPALTSQAWRTRLSFTRALAVQASCAEYLDIFGYRNFTHSDEYNRLNLSNLRKNISNLELIAQRL